MGCSTNVWQTSSHLWLDVAVYDAQVMQPSHALHKAVADSVGHRVVRSGPVATPYPSIAGQPALATRVRGPYTPCLAEGRQAFVCVGTLHNQYV